MPILFSAVARYKTVLAKHASCDGNFTEILEEVLSKIPPKNEKMTYSHGRYLLNYICNLNGYFYFCITVKTCQRSRAFLYLNEIARKFRPRHGEFHKVLAEEMRRFSEDYSTVVIRKGDLDELNNIGVGSSAARSPLLDMGLLQIEGFAAIATLGRRVGDRSMVSKVRGRTLLPVFRFLNPLVSYDKCVLMCTNNVETILGEKILLVKNSEKLTFGKLSYVGGAPQHAMSDGEKDNYCLKFYIIALTVILVVMWWIINKIGIVSFVLMVCLVVFSIVRLSKIVKIKC